MRQTRTWLITGCSTGIGRGIAGAVLQKGENAVVTARDKNRVKDFEERYPGKALAVTLDMERPGDHCPGGRAGPGAVWLY